MRTSRLVGCARRSLASRAPEFPRIDVYAIAPAGAVVNKWEQSMKVRVGFNEVRGSVRGEVSVHVIHVHAVAQAVVWEHITGRRVVGPTLVAGYHPAHRDA